MALFVSVVTPNTLPSSLTSKVLSVTAQSLMELIGKANLRTVGLFQERARSQAPFLHRHYPASSVLRACPPPNALRPMPRGVPVESHDLSALGLPVLPVDSSFTHAIANTPAGPVEPYRSRHSTSGGLPRRSFRSAPALRVSRIARRSLALWPACSLTP
jgi:hypothetical protein